MATWNVHRCKGKIQEIIKEKEQLRINIASITETKKKGSASEVSGNYLHFYIGVPKENGAKRGVSLLIHKKWKHNITNWLCIDERIITVNINILKTRFAITGPNEDEQQQIKISSTRLSNRELVLIGDFNARTGRSSNSNIIGRFGEEESNDNGVRLIDLCEKKT